MSRLLRVPFVSGLAGGGLVAGILLAAGVGGGGTTTVVQQAPLAASPAAPRNGAVTAAQIYRRRHPQGWVPLATGVVSAGQRAIPAPNGFAINSVIQTDASLKPGTSGGPLLDARGQVIGINSQIETGGNGGGSVGIGFAVPIDTAKQVLPQL